MKRIFLLLLFTTFFLQPKAQDESILHKGSFKKGKLFMSSKPYKPDDWEKSYFESAIRAAFPSDLNRSPEKYQGKLIHLLGIADSVYRDSSATKVNILLTNKYWDYIEDYSIQDEVMFVSPKGDGKFLVTINSAYQPAYELLTTFPRQKKLILVYGNFIEAKNSLPVIEALQLKYIDYEQYTTAVFSYEIKRNKNGEVEVDKKGKPQLTNFNFVKVAKAGQNK